MRSFYKRPSDTLTVTLDFTEFVAENPGATITYELRADVGITVLTDNGATPGIFTLRVDGGTNGRAYEFGIEATAVDADGEGDSSVQQCKVRLRDVPEWGGVPIVGDIGGGANAIFLVDANGNLLVDSLGRALYLG